MEYPPFITGATWSDITATCWWLPQTPRPHLRVRQLDNFHGPALASAIPIHLHATDELRLWKKTWLVNLRKFFVLLPDAGRSHGADCRDRKTVFALGQLLSDIGRFHLQILPRGSIDPAETITYVEGYLGENVLPIRASHVEARRCRCLFMTSVSQSAIY
jgi:hypothetical protein